MKFTVLERSSSRGLPGRVASSFNHSEQVRVVVAKVRIWDSRISRACGQADVRYLGSASSKVGAGKYIGERGVNSGRVKTSGTHYERGRHPDGPAGVDAPTRLDMAPEWFDGFTIKARFHLLTGQRFEIPDALKGPASKWKDYQRVAGHGQITRLLSGDDRAYFLGAHLDNGNPEVLLNSISRYYKFLPGEQQRSFLENLPEKAP